MTGRRASFLTWNLWGDERWMSRADSVRALLLSVRPDVVAVQELCSTTLWCLDRFLDGHSRVDDDFQGWSGGSNIWWNRSLLARVEHGHEDIGNPDGDRHLFWVRLEPRSTDRGSTFVVATAHLVWDDFPDPERGPTIRRAQAEQIRIALRRAAVDDEPVILLGDLNHLGSDLPGLERAGLRDCFEVLGVERPPTQPIVEYENVVTLPRAVDRIMARGRIRPTEAAVPQGDLSLPPPSDHLPVFAIYEWLD